VPPMLEAHEPPEARGLTRDGVRLLVTDRRDDRVAHARFTDLPTFLDPGDLVVVNDSATLPAALTARRADGSELALHLSSHLPADLWVVEPRHVRPEEGERLNLPAGASARLLAPYPESQRLWVARLELPQPVVDYLQGWGRPIAYPYVHGEWPIEMYQTVYAREPGSAEMPSAGRPFTAEIFNRLAHKGVRVATITLHTGVASLEQDELPYEEPYRVLPETAEAVTSTRAAGGRVVAVGTTVVRALEAAATEDGHLRSGEGLAKGRIGPSTRLRVVDAILSGTHERGTSHYELLRAFLEDSTLQRATEELDACGYKTHEFGDSILIL
jgi:S-adenosylmethionine:tRNA ribosyltransferase-isomerase